MAKALRVCQTCPHPIHVPGYGLYSPGETIPQAAIAIFAAALEQYVSAGFLELVDLVEETIAEARRDPGPGEAVGRAAGKAARASSKATEAAAHAATAHAAGVAAEAASAATGAPAAPVTAGAVVVPPVV